MVWKDGQVNLWRHQEEILLFLMIRAFVLRDTLSLTRYHQMLLFVKNEGEKEA
jgi:hypothetical protein